MNDARRKEIQRAVGLIDEAKGILETALAGEQNAQIAVTALRYLAEDGAIAGRDLFWHEA